MKRTAFAIVVLTVSALPMISLAENKNYFTFQLGGAFPIRKLSHETSMVGIKDNSLKNAVVYDLAIGREVYNNTFLELELAYAKHKFSSSYSELSHDANFASKIHSTSGFANLNYRFKDIGTQFVPYIMAGMGIASNRTRDTTFIEPAINITRTSSSKTKTNFAWQIGAGVLMPLNETVEINLSYKYRDLGKISASETMMRNDGTIDKFDTSVLSGRLQTSNILIGVALNF